ncbi:MAG: NAD-dependent epimerase/dehydratase family protein [bacterium]|nr:NAD-dependent epimerase/dehydratase family protein [bacterium]
MERILVTGSSGFIGSHIVRQALAKGHHVIALGKSRMPSFSHPNCTSYMIDLLDKDALDRCVSKERPTVISHHASTTSFVYESLSMMQSLPLDTIASINLLNAAVAHNVRQFVFASSASVYSPTIRGACTEDGVIHPTSPLGISKLSIEYYCQYFQSQTKLSCCILRYFNVYGPGQRQGEQAGIVPNIIRKAIEKSTLTVFHNGEQTRDFVYVEDVARANLAVVTANAGGIFNVGSGKEVSINTLITSVEKLMRRKIKVVYIPKSVASLRSVAAIERIQKEVKWKPRKPLAKGLKETIAYYQKTR